MYVLKMQIKANYSFQEYLYEAIVELGASLVGTAAHNFVLDTMETRGLFRQEVFKLGIKVSHL